MKPVLTLHRSRMKNQAVLSDAEDRRAKRAPHDYLNLSGKPRLAAMFSAHR